MPPKGFSSSDEFVAEALADLFEHADAFGDDLGTDAIAGDDRNGGFHRWLLLVRFDGCVLREQEAELIDAIQQAVARETFERKFHLRAVGQRERGAFDVDGDFDARIGEQPRVSLLVDDDGQQAVLQAVGAEDVGELGADDGLESEILQRPGRMFTRRPATDVAAGDENRGAFRFGTVQHEIGLRIAGGVVAPVGEQMFAESGLRRGGEKPRRDDLVGVDVGRGQRDGAGADVLYGHVGQLANSRGSVTRPRMADAAAVSGLASSVRAPTPWRPSKFRLLVLME